MPELIYPELGFKSGIIQQRHNSFPVGVVLRGF
jgi:hypothetical protein